MPAARDILVGSYGGSVANRAVEQPAEMTTGSRSALCRCLRVLTFRLPAQPVIVAVADVHDERGPFVQECGDLVLVAKRRTSCRLPGASMRSSPG